MQQQHQRSETPKPRQTTRSLPRITKERLAALVADYESGMTAYELADKYGHHRSTIMRQLAQAGVHSRMATPTAAEISRWRELYDTGMGIKTIACQVGRNDKTIRKYILRLPMQEVVL